MVLPTCTPPPFGECSVTITVNSPKNDSRSQSMWSQWPLKKIKQTLRGSGVMENCPNYTAANQHPGYRAGQDLLLLHSTTLMAALLPCVSLWYYSGCRSWHHARQCNSSAVVGWLESRLFRLWRSVFKSEKKVEVEETWTFTRGEGLTKKIQCFWILTCSDSLMFGHTDSFKGYFFIYFIIF